MEALYSKEIPVILWLQETLSTYSDSLLFLSKFGDPGAILMYFPVIFYVNNTLGVLVVWSSLIAEWTNLVLKWFLRGERPYWWIQEAADFKHLALTQYPLTCETGPGSPSGHAMVSTAALFTIVSFLVVKIRELLHSQPVFCQLVCNLIWLCLLAIISLISLSRVFIATHFPHQVVGGALAGIAISCTTQRYSAKFMKLSLKKCFMISFGIITSTIAIYIILSYAVFDPSESVQKAQKCCSNPSYIHIETRPFYALVRDAGTALGFGLASSLCTTYGVDKGKVRGVGLKVVLALLYIYYVHLFKVSFDSDFLSYGFVYLRFVLNMCTIYFAIPFIFSWSEKIFNDKHKSI